MKKNQTFSPSCGCYSWDVFNILYDSAYCNGNKQPCWFKNRKVRVEII